MNTRFEEKLKAIPEIPKKFGEDGGHFYRYYDNLADEIDEDMVKSLKSQLDGILIFAGLFAGVNTAFLALTLPEMSADPADDTNALLLQFVTGGNGSIHSAEDLPSASFSPASSILPINILFSLSLTLALLAAFLAVLGQQWLVYYLKRSGGGAEAQRWEQLRRYLGARRWRLEAILDDVLPSLLQSGLVIFCISFVLYLGTLSGPMCYTVAVPMGLALACLMLMAICAAYDHWCPFKSPLSHLFQLTPRSIMGPILLLLHWASVVSKEGEHFIMYRIEFYMLEPIRKAERFISKITQGLVHRSSEGGDTSEVGQHFVITATRSAIRSCTSRTRRTFRRAVWYIKDSTRVPIHESERRAGTWAPTFNSGSIASWVAKNVQTRRAEPVDRLKSMAAKRVICTSEDRNALIYAAVNLRAITSGEEARWLLSDDEFYSRLSEPWRVDNSILNNIQHSDSRAVEMVAFSNSLFHLIPSSSSLAFIFPPDKRPSVPFHISGEYPVNEKQDYAPSRIYFAVNYMRNFGIESSCPHCAQCMMSSLLCILIYDQSSQVKMDNWFEQFSTSLAHFSEEEATLVTGLLAWAVEAYMARESHRVHWAGDVGERIWHAVCKIARIYRTCSDAESAVDDALEVFPSVDSPSRPSDGVCVMFLERACSSLEPYSGRFKQFKLIAKHALDLFQNIIHQETWNQLSKHTEKDLVARCINVIVWTFARMTRLYDFERSDFIIDCSSGLKICLNSAEQISTRKSGMLDVSAFLIFLRIRDKLMSPDEYAEGLGSLILYRSVNVSKYNSVYDELVACIARLESVVLAVQRTADPMMANPADPVPVLVVDGEDEPGGNAADGQNPPGGKFSCHLFL